MDRAQQLLKSPIINVTFIFLIGIMIIGVSNPLFAAQLPSTTQAPTQTTTTIPTPSPASLPTVNDGEVIALAKDTAIAVFNYDYQNFQQKLQLASKNFTATGWQTFTKALDSSNNLSSMQQYRITMTGQITGEAKIIKHTLQNNEESWSVEMPMEVTYISANNQRLVHNYLVKVGITNVDKSENASGIAVVQFVARPYSTKK